MAATTGLPFIQVYIDGTYQVNTCTYRPSSDTITDIDPAESVMMPYEYQYVTLPNGISYMVDYFSGYGFDAVYQVTDDIVPKDKIIDTGRT